MHAMRKPCSFMRAGFMTGEPGEPSTNDSGGAAWCEAIERCRHARDHGHVAAGTWTDLLVVNGARLADITRRRLQAALMLEP